MIVYNPKTGAAIKKFMVDRVEYRLPVNTMAKFPDNIGKELLKRFGFLIEVKPEDVVKTKEMMKVKAFKCEHCPIEFETEKELHAHGLGKHKLSNETKEILDSVDEAETIHYGEPRKGQPLTPENVEGIPTGKATDKDGVEWYGEGWTTDSGFTPKPRPFGNF